MILLLASMLLACDMGPSDATLLDDLTIVAMLADPPEASPGELVNLETVVVDPVGEGYEQLRWTCTNTGDGCAEAEVPGSAWLGLDTSLESNSQVFIPEEFAAFATETPLPLVELRVLACAPGVCPVMDLAASEPEEGSAEAEELQALLSDPADLLDDLPFEGVGLGTRRINVSTRSADARLQNPTVSCMVDEEGSPAVVDQGGEIPFVCAVTGDFSGGAAALWGYTTGGGWEGSSFVLEPDDALVEYKWFAPTDETGVVEVWVVLADGLGGIGLWSSEVTVEAGG